MFKSKEKKKRKVELKEVDSVLYIL